MRQSILVLAGLVAVAAPLAGQGRQVALTGRPQAALPDEPFTTINGLAEVAPGKVVISDVQEMRLVLADLRAGTVRDIGRKGGGPGEWQMPVSVLRGTNNRAIVGDPGLQKLHLVGADGKISGAILPEAEETRASIGIAMARGTDARGRLYYQAMPNFQSGGIPDSVEIARYDPAAKRVETLARVPSGMTGGVQRSGGNVSVTMRAKPYGEADAWAVLPDGRVAIVRANPYRVDIASGPGTVQRGPVIPHAPVRIGKAERDAYRERLASARPMMISIGGGGGGARSAPAAGGGQRAEIPDSDFPEVMPPFSGQGAVQVTPEGEIWVQRTRAASDKTPTYDIFNSAGQLVGKATLKPNSTVVGFGAGVVYVARQDPADDLRYLEMYSR